MGDNRRVTEISGRTQTNESSRFLICCSFKNQMDSPNLVGKNKWGSIVLMILFVPIVLLVTAGIMLFVMYFSVRGAYKDVPVDSPVPSSVVVDR